MGKTRNTYPSPRNAFPMHAAVIFFYGRGGFLNFVSTGPYQKRTKCAVHTRPPETRHLDLETVLLSGGRSGPVRGLPASFALTLVHICPETKVLRNASIAMTKAKNTTSEQSRAQQR